MTDRKDHFRAMALMLVFPLAMLLPPAVVAGEITLAWTAAEDAVTAGYELEVLSLDGRQLQQLDVGDATRAVVTELEDGVVYRFRVRPYDAWDHLSSETSREVVSMPAPRIDAISGEAVGVKPIRVSLEGANFADGAWVVAIAKGLIVENTVVIRHDLAIVTLRREGEALRAEPAELLVVNPVPKAEAYLRAHPELLDFDRSGQVDEKDLETLEALFGVGRSDPRFRPELDPTGDGLIDGADLAMLRSLLARRRPSRLRGRP